MAKYVIDGATLSAIADSIRDKKGTAENITPENMPTEIASIEIGGAPTPTQEKTVDITENGTVQVVPDEGYALSKVTANVNVPIPDGYIKPSGTLEVTENGTHDVTEYASVSVNVSSSGGDTDLPSGCRRVDYIKFSGKQIVDTDIVCNQDTKIHIIFTRESSSQEYLYGVASSGNTASVTAYLGGSWRFGNKYATKPTGTVRTELGYFGFVHKSEIGVTGSISAISGVDDFETIGTLLIGTCRAADGSIGNPQYDGKIDTFVMWQGSERVLKLIPVVDEEGNYHFWDSVNKRYHDSITGTPLDGGNY